MANSGFPNCFWILGPNAYFVHNSVLFAIECQVTYIVDCIRQLQARGSGDGKKSMELTSTAFDAFVEWSRQAASKLTYGRGCRSWYQDKEGVVYTLWPATSFTFWRKTRRCKVKDYTFA